MKRLQRLFFLLANLIALAVSCEATTRSTDYPGSVTLLLEVPEVQKELWLDKAQVGRIHALRRELKSRSRSLVQKVKPTEIDGLTADQRLFALIDSTNSKALALLTPTQLDRFHQLQNQILGYTMLVSPKLQKQLDLSKNKIQAIEKIRTEGLAFVAETNRAYEHRDISHAKRIELLRNYRLEQSSRMRGVLTDAQNRLFAELCGSHL
jgi:hypothetical protein